MGASNFMKSCIGISAKEVWNSLVEDATYEKGHDKYNGSINTCELGKCTLRFDKPNATNEKKAIKYIEDNSYGVKGFANYIDLGVYEYRVITFKKEVTKNNPTYKLQYVVVEGSGWDDGKTIKPFDEKTKADDHALDLSMKNPNNRYCVEKKYVLVKGDKVVSRIKKELKAYKSKPNLKPMKNRIIVPIHKYIYYGWASR